MAFILDGQQAREALMPGLLERIRSLPHAPTLAIIQVGDRPDSASFIRGKISFAKRIGIAVKHIQKPETATEKDVLDAIHECNADSAIHGIIVQMPLPIHMSADRIIEAISSRKDVDGLTAENVKAWMEGREDAIFPATARGIRTLLRHYDIELFGKTVAVVGRSMLVGRPAIAMCLNENATVIACHSKTPDLAAATRSADIIIVAAGKPGLIGAGNIREGQTVIDVGINKAAHGAIVGDVDFESVKGIVRAITPVPGGVGPMTVLSLFENLVDLCMR